MLKTQGAGQAARLKSYFREVGYTPDGVRNRIQTSLLAGRHLENLPLLLHRTRELDALNLLIRWFVVDEPVTHESARQLLPPDILQLLLDCGLLTLTDERLTSSVMFGPFEEFWFATDTYARLSKGTGEDDVLMVNTTTLFLMNLAIRTPCRTLLDLGTGCGIVSVIVGAQCAEQVTATDLTGRACTFARFNAWLNEKPNIDVLTGDLFQPVAGRKFDRILTNPPFYITPSSHRMFAENPNDLDGFCRNLVEQAPQYLEEGGMLQMLFEWAEIEGQPWEQRLASWFAGSGCDAMVFEGGRYDPIRYAESRIPVVSAPAGREGDARRFDEWVDYYKTRNVTGIHAGFLTMRRRSVKNSSGQNWLHFERVLSDITLPCGEAILRRFTVRDQPVSDEHLLSARLQVTEGVQLRPVVEFREQKWHRAPNVQMIQTSGLQLLHDITPDVADFVVAMDGSAPLRELVDRLAGEAAAPPEKVQMECISLVRRLLDRGFLRELPQAGEPLSLH